MWPSFPSTLSANARGQGWVRAITLLQVIFVGSATLARLPLDHPDILPVYRRLRAWANFKRLKLRFFRVVRDARARGVTLLDVIGEPPVDGAMALGAARALPLADDASETKVQLARVQEQLALQQQQLAMLCELMPKLLMQHGDAHGGGAQTASAGIPFLGQFSRRVADKGSLAA